jgi:hypothetical protein
MIERLQSSFMFLSLGLALLLVYQVASLITRPSPHPQAQPLSLNTSPQPQTVPVSSNPHPSRLPAEIPAAVRQQAERIRDSEIFGPVQRPLPMALLGIAGPDVFLRGPNGQTGLLREGGQLGGIKLVRVGVNRVLVEHEGELKELTIFEGLGSEALLPKEQEKK